MKATILPSAVILTKARKAAAVSMMAKGCIVAIIATGILPPPNTSLYSLSVDSKY